MMDGRTLAICAIITMLGATTSACSEGAGDAVESQAVYEGAATEISEKQVNLETLREKYPRILAGDIVLPSRADLKDPGFDLGGHCLAEEAAGHGSFEQCLDVVGREFIVIAATD